jgi:outer membrane receptor for monomeric catechols
LPVAVNSRPWTRRFLYEAGAKVSLLDGRLGLAGALFKVDKSNSFDVDPGR